MELSMGIAEEMAFPDRGNMIEDLRNESIR